jgi:hypothetical protein
MPKWFVATGGDHDPAASGRIAGEATYQGQIVEAPDAGSAFQQWLEARYGKAPAPSDWRTMPRTVHVFAWAPIDHVRFWHQAPQYVTIDRDPEA